MYVADDKIANTNAEIMRFTQPLGDAPFEYTKVSGSGC